MKRAIPIVDGQLCLHFGHCAHFALVDVDEVAGEVGLDKGFRADGGATDDDLDAVLLEQILGAGAHAAGEDDGGALFMQPFGQHAGLVRRWLDQFRRGDFLGGLVYVDQREMRAMAEMQAELSIDDRNGDFHGVPFLFIHTRRRLRCRRGGRRWGIRARVRLRPACRCSAAGR